MTDPDATAEATDVADPAVPDDQVDTTDDIGDESAETDEAPAADAAPDDTVAGSDDLSGDGIDPGTPETPEEHAAAADVVAPDQVPAAADDDLDDLTEPDAASDDADDLDDLLGLAGADDDEESEPTPDATESDDEVPAPSDDATPAEPVRRRRPESMEDVRDRRDLIRLAGDWFVVHTYSGYEQRVKDNLTNRIEALAAEDRIYELVIPTEEVTEFKKGKKQTTEKKFLPGYVLIRMDLDDETWNIVRHTPAVTGFVGATASKPVPLSLREVAATLKIPDRIEEDADGEEIVEDTKPQVAEIDLEVDETIRVTSGPFADFTGTIAEINLDQAKLRVMVSVFGRETPLELPFDQVAKIT